jgi:hypothetical protein
MAKRNKKGAITGNLTHSLTHSLIHSPIHSFTYSLIRLFTHPLIHSFTHSLIHLFTHSLIHSFTRSLIHSFAHSSFDNFPSRPQPASRQRPQSALPSNHRALAVPQPENTAAWAVPQLQNTADCDTARDAVPHFMANLRYGILQTSAISPLTAGAVFCGNDALRSNTEMHCKLVSNGFLRRAVRQVLQDAQYTMRYRRTRSIFAVCGTAFAVFCSILENADARNERANAGMVHAARRTWSMPHGEHHWENTRHKVCDLLHGICLENRKRETDCRERQMIARREKRGGEGTGIRVWIMQQLNIEFWLHSAKTRRHRGMCQGGSGTVALP